MAVGLCGKGASGWVLPSRTPATDFMQHELVNSIVLVCMGRWLLMVNGPDVSPPTTTFEICNAMLPDLGGHANEPCGVLSCALLPASCGRGIHSFLLYLVLAMSFFIGALWCIHLYLNVIGTTWYIFKQSKILLESDDVGLDINWTLPLQLLTCVIDATGSCFKACCHVRVESTWNIRKHQCSPYLVLSSSRVFQLRVDTFWNSL